MGNWDLVLQEEGLTIVNTILRSTAMAVSDGFFKDIFWQNQQYDTWYLESQSELVRLYGIAVVVYKLAKFHNISGCITMACDGDSAPLMF